MEGRTNAKLKYAKLHLEELEKNWIPGSDFERAHQESFLFHLIGALDSFYQELNEYYELRIELSKVTLKTLNKELRKKGIESIALNEIKRLSDDADSWLSQAMEIRNHGTHRSNVPRIFYQGGPQHGKMCLRNPKTGGEIEKDCKELMYEWLEKMVKMILRFRQDEFGILYPDLF
jgi:hypothetical protein